MQLSPQGLPAEQRLQQPLVEAAGGGADGRGVEVAVGNGAVRGAAGAVVGAGLVAVGATSAGGAAITGAGRVAVAAGGTVGADVAVEAGAVAVGIDSATDPGPADRNSAAAHPSAPSGARIFRHARPAACRSSPRSATRSPSLADAIRSPFGSRRMTTPLPPVPRTDIARSGALLGCTGVAGACVGCTGAVVGGRGAAVGGTGVATCTGAVVGASVATTTWVGCAGDPSIALRAVPMPTMTARPATAAPDSHISWRMSAHLPQGVTRSTSVNDRRANCMMVSCLHVRRCPLDRTLQCVCLLYVTTISGFGGKTTVQIPRVRMRRQPARGCRLVVAVTDQPCCANFDASRWKLPLLL